MTTKPCRWCGQPILPSELLGAHGRLLMHTECRTAMHEMVSDCGPDAEFRPQRERRGCWCGGDPWCDKCLPHPRTLEQHRAAWPHAAVEA